MPRANQRSRHIDASYIFSAANAPNSNVSLYVRPQHDIVSPSLAPSGSVMTASQSGQLTRQARVADQRPPSSRTRRAWPAQLGHSTRSPEPTPGGSSIMAPQSVQRTAGMIKFLV